MCKNLVFIDSDEAENILSPPNHLLYETEDCVLLYLMAGKESFCIACVSPWTTYYCYSFPEVNRCLSQIDKDYFGGKYYGHSRLTEKG